MKRLRIGILLIMTVAMLITATPVFADTNDPDTSPIILEFNVYRNVLETADMLFLILADIPYATPPSTLINDTFVWRLIDTDGTTELGTSVGYAFNTSGYNENVFSMYWSAADVASLGIVWGTNYGVRLSGNPAVFDTVPVYNYTIGSGAYSATVDTAAVKAEIATRIIALGGILDAAWGLVPTSTLLNENEAVTTLSILGESFFRGAINGLQAMAPAAFSSVITNIDVEDRTWTQEYVTNVSNQWAGTWVETSTAAGEVLFGTSYDMLSIILLLGCAFGLLVGNIALTGDHWNGLIDVSLIGVVGARLGLYDLFFLLLIAAICWIYISLKVWFGMIK